MPDGVSQWATLVLVLVLVGMVGKVAMVGMVEMVAMADEARTWKSEAHVQHPLPVATS